MVFHPHEGSPHEVFRVGDLVVRNQPGCFQRFEVVQLWRTLAKVVPVGFKQGAWVQANTLVIAADQNVGQ